MDLERCRLREDETRAPDDCALLLHLTVQNIDASDAEPMAVEGRCAPDWSGAHRAARGTLELGDHDPLP
jgi:hypothetical protein